MSEEYRKYDDFDEYDDLSDEGLHIDWMGIIAKMLKGWKFILIFTFIFGVLGIISALTMKREWSTTVTLAPEVQQRTNSSSLNSLASMLGMGNAQLAAGTDALNISLFPTICKSTPFLVSLFDVELTRPATAEEKEAGITPKPVTLYDHITGADRPQKKSLLDRIFGKEEVVEPEGPVNPTSLTRKQSAVVGYLRSNVTASVDSKTGVTSISVVTDNRYYSQQLADTVCKALQTYFVDYRTQKARDDYKHYVQLAEDAKADWEKAQAAYAASVDSDRNVILQAATSERQRLQTEVNVTGQIYSQMAQQRELAKAKIQEEKPVYAVIQPASVPIHPTSSKKTRVLIFGFIGAFLSCCWAGFGKDLWKSFMSSLKESLKKDPEKEKELLEAPGK